MSAASRPPEDPSDFRSLQLRKDDFLGAFGLLWRGDLLLMVRNERMVRGVLTTTWDLPGGQVEPGELLHEALARELREEARVEVVGTPKLLFLQEGLKVKGGSRRHAWRSFFFAVDEHAGEPQAGGEVLDVRWVPRAELHGVLTAPYHDSFRDWLVRGGTHFQSRWEEP